jgi:pyruvate,water dikinase
VKTGLQRPDSAVALDSSGKADAAPAARSVGIIPERPKNLAARTLTIRELGIPAIVGTGTGTSSIGMGEDVTVSCAEGDEGFVYRGRLPVRVERTNLADLARPRTHMMMNVANPAEAFSLSFL